MSNILFAVSERPVFMANGSGHIVEMPNHKCLYRKDTGAPLNVVRSTYRTIQTADFLHAIESQIEAEVGTRALQEAIICDDLTGNGETVKRDYVFPSITVPCERDSRSEIAFRLIAFNGFGTTAAKLLYGGIDFYCSNGMIIGEDIRNLTVRHVGTESLINRLSPIRDAVIEFNEKSRHWKRWQSTMVTRDSVRNFLLLTVSEKLREKLMKQVEIEFLNRGMTLWALYSALTYYASHAEGFFDVSSRSRDNNTVMRVMDKRQQAVRRLTSTFHWKALESGTSWL